MDELQSNNAFDFNELRRKRLEAIISISGSEASLKDENKTVVIPVKEDIASSLVFKTLKRDKIDEDKVKNAINVDLSELKPTIPKQNPNQYVSAELYDEQLKLVQSLFDQIQALNNNINSLKDEIGNLKGDLQAAVNDKLGTEQSNDALANQLDSLSKTIDSFTDQVQTSVQKSIEESILRASLQAQNMGFKAQIEALVKQVDTLNSIIEGLQSQMGAVQQQQAIFQAAESVALATGGKIVNDVVIASANPAAPPSDAEIIGRINNLTYESRWEYGSQFNLTNNDVNSVTITVTVVNPSGQNWLLCPLNTLELAPGDTKTVDLVFNVGGCSFSAGGNSASYGGAIRVSAKRKDGSEASNNVETKLNIMHPDFY